MSRPPADSVNAFTENMTYDNNGNMTTWGFREGDGVKYTYTYDAFGRMTKVQSNLNGLSLTDLTKYRYNGLGFRIMWQYDTDFSQTLVNSERYYFMYDDRWRIVGTFRDQDASPKESFAYHNAGRAGRGQSSYIDSVILRDKDANTAWTAASDGTLEERRYYSQNWRADVVALSHSDGKPVEFVRYTSYGKAQVFAWADANMDGVVNATDSTDWSNLFNNLASNAAISKDFNYDGVNNATDNTDFNTVFTATSGYTNSGLLSSVGNRKGYAGYEFDQPVEAYHVRHRVYLPEVGRWTRRDLFGYIDGPNMYEYVAGFAMNAIDPMGLQLELTAPPAAGVLAVCYEGAEGVVCTVTGVLSAPAVCIGGTAAGGVCLGYYVSSRWIPWDRVFPPVNLPPLALPIPRAPAVPLPPLRIPIDVPYPWEVPIDITPPLDVPIDITPGDPVGPPPPDDSARRALCFVLHAAYTVACAGLGGRSNVRCNANDSCELIATKGIALAACALARAAHKAAGCYDFPDQWNPAQHQKSLDHFTNRAAECAAMFVNHQPPCISTW